MKAFRALGVMSGSSLDGLDLALCQFVHKKKWQYEFIKTECLPFPSNLKSKLENCRELKRDELNELDLKFGDWIGEMVNSLLKDINEFPDLIASHGHTVFHQPQNKFTLQIGDGKMILKKTGIKTITNFRQKDIELGGQGAPLVPVSDHFLFSDFDICINLGGIANMTVLRKPMLAFDIGPCNQVLNYFSRRFGKAFDENGEIARQGSYNTAWYDEIKSLDFFQKPPPKAMSNEWIAEMLLSETFIEPPEDYLHTFCHFITDQIVQQIRPSQRILVTGGGAKNNFLIGLLRQKSQAQIIVPHQQLIDFKEALSFAFLGLLRVNNEDNVYASVTGALRNSCSGEIHM